MNAVTNVVEASRSTSPRLNTHCGMTRARRCVNGSAAVTAAEPANRNSIPTTTSINPPGDPPIVAHRAHRDQRKLRATPLRRAGSHPSTCYGRAMSRPHPRDYFNNFSTSDLPLLEKLRLVAKNNAIKIKNGTSCCGNHGEPGC
jgi:hypothetical protein